jgi:hypothetical protein
MVKNKKNSKILLVDDTKSRRGNLQKRMKLTSDSSSENPQSSTEGKNIIWLKVKDDENMLETLVTKENINKPNGSEDGFTVLHLATANNRKSLVKKLLEKGANPNVKDLDGNTPLHFAAEENNLEIFELLVTNKANINETNESGWSILHSAASGIINRREDWNIIKLMLKKGVKIDVKTKSEIEVEDIFLKVDYSYVARYEELIEENFLSSQIAVE